MHLAIKLSVCPVGARRHLWDQSLSHIIQLLVSFSPALCSKGCHGTLPARRLGLPPSGGLIVCWILRQAVRTAGSALNSVGKMIFVNLQLLLPCLLITLQGVSCKRWLPLVRCASPHGRSVKIWLIACELWELGWICARF